MKVLIAYDGSEGGRDALALGSLLASLEGSRCIVAIPRDTDLAAEARSSLDDPSAEVEEIGVLSPAMMLVESAERHYAETLVVGSTRPKDTVMATYPGPGSTADAGTVVLAVSRGQ